MRQLSSPVALSPLPRGSVSTPARASPPPRSSAMLCLPSIALCRRPLPSTALYGRLLRCPTTDPQREIESLRDQMDAYYTLAQVQSRQECVTVLFCRARFQVQPEDVKEGYLDLLGSMLEYDPANRPTAAAALETLIQLGQEEEEGSVMVSTA